MDDTEAAIDPILINEALARALPPALPVFYPSDHDHMPSMARSPPILRHIDEPPSYECVTKGSEDPPPYLSCF